MPCLPPSAQPAVAVASNGLADGDCSAGLPKSRPMTGRALLAVGEHLELVVQLIKSQAQVAAESGSESAELHAQHLFSVLARSTAALSQDYREVPVAGNGEKALESATDEKAFASTSDTDAADGVLSQMDPWDSQHTLRQVDRGDSQYTTGSDSTGIKAYIGASLFHGKKGRFFARTPSNNRVLLQLEKVMESHLAECFFAGLILFNVTFMILEAQFRGAKLGNAIGFHSYYGSDSWFQDTHALGTDDFTVAEWVFATLFTIELLLRLVLLRFDFLCDPWGWLDITVVCITDLILVGGMNFMNVSVIRSLRLARLLRIVKLARKIQTFDSLYLMTTALSGSVSVLLWVVILLFVIQTLFALLLTSVVQDFYLDEDGLTPTQKDEIYVYFGTYWRAMVSLFELMLANWPPICRLMMETMYEPWSIFAIGYKLTMGFAVIGVIFGVFTQETFRAAETDDQLMLRKKTSQTQLHTRKMKFLFEKIAGKHDLVDVQVDVKQFKSFLQDPDIQLWLKAMDYDTGDASLLFYLIDKNGDGNLTLDELIEGMASLKGDARNIDVKLLLRQSLIGRMQRAMDGKDGRRLSTTDALKMIEREPTTPEPSFGLSRGRSLYGQSAWRAHT